MDPTPPSPPSSTASGASSPRSPTPQPAIASSPRTSRRTRSSPPGVTEQVVHKRLSRGRRYLAEGVEHVIAGELERPGKRRNLAACVLAALPTHAASGSKMFKLTSLALATVTVGTIAAWSHPAASRAPSATTPPPSSMTVTSTPFASHSTRPPALPQVTCDDVAHRLVANVRRPIARGRADRRGRQANAIQRPHGTAFLAVSGRCPSRAVDQGGEEAGRDLHEGVHAAALSVGLDRVARHAARAAGAREPGAARISVRTSRSRPAIATSSGRCAAPLRIASHLLEPARRARGEWALRASTGAAGMQRARPRRVDSKEDCV